MPGKLFFLLFGVIIVLALVQRIIPILGHNFYFTIDQGNDAVYVREILQRNQVLLKGPETDISGLFAGPGWYYFLALGYKLFNGDPFGGVFMLILLNTTLLGLIMYVVSKRLTKSWGILVGFFLLTSWWFFETSRYAFNPFFLVSLSFSLIFLLVDFIQGKKINFLLAAIPIGVGFHVEIAGSTALLLFYFLVGIWAMHKKKISFKLFVGGFLVLSLFFVPHLISEIKSGFTQIYSLLREFKQPEGAFSNSQLISLTNYLIGQVSQVTFSASKLIGLLIFSTILFIFYKHPAKKASQFVRTFSTLSFVLVLVTWLFFSSNNGWKDWQTIYIYPVIFVSVLLLLSQIKIKFALFFLILMLLTQTKVFIERYSQALFVSDDQSILSNEISAIDWVYKEGVGRGFNVYSYVPPAVDYPYQYLFWWHGLKKYKYVPCDYSSYPGSPKPFYIPGSMYYENPQKECTNLRFLIIEPGQDIQTRENWLEGTRKETSLISEKYVGKIKVEKRILNIIKQ